jgi:hypothetical protein
VRQILLHPLGIFDSYVCLIQNKIFFGTLRRISDLTNLAVTSRAFSCFLNPGLHGSHPHPFNKRKRTNNDEPFFQQCAVGSPLDIYAVQGISFHETCERETYEGGAKGNN